MLLLLLGFFYSFPINEETLVFEYGDEQAVNGRLMVEPVDAIFYKDILYILDIFHTRNNKLTYFSFQAKNGDLLHRNKAHFLKVNLLQS